MDRIFAQAKVNNAKYAPLHAAQLLEQMTEKVVHINAIQHSGCHIGPDDWSELYALANSAQAVLEILKSNKTPLNKTLTGKGTIQ